MRVHNMNDMVSGPELLPVPEEIAQSRWEVDLKNDRMVLQKLVEFAGKLPDTIDLIRLWHEHQHLKAIIDEDREQTL